MGKNPNAKKLKEKRHKDKVYSTNIEDLEEEAARKGVSVLELEQIRQDLQDDSEDNSDSGEEGQQPKKQKKLVESSEDD